MIDLYTAPTGNGLRAAVALAESGLAYKINKLDLGKGEAKSPEYLKINPAAIIPAIVDHEGPGGKPYTCFESGAILMYLAEKTGKLMPKDMAKKYDVIQWLMIQMTGVGPASGQLVHFKRFAPQGDHAYSLSRYQTEVRRLYDVLESRLGQTAYLGGADYSIADIATFPWARNHDFLGVKWDDHPNCARWFNAIAGREAVKRALAKVDAIQSSRDNAKPEDLDRFFGRGRYARA